MSSYEKKEKVALYLRCSTVHQNLDVQLNDLSRYAEARGFEIVAVFKDHGVSGKRDSRPALDEMLKAAKQRKFSCLLIHALDRLGRNTRHLLTLIEEFEALQISLVSYREAIDLGSPIGRVMVTVLSALCAFERETLRDRVMRGLENARRQGKRIGRPRKVNRERVKDLRSQGFTYRKIVQATGYSMGAIQSSLSERQ